MTKTIKYWKLLGALNVRKFIINKKLEFSREENEPHDLMGFSNFIKSPKNIQRSGQFKMYLGNAHLHGVGRMIIVNPHGD